ncbi:hypothetical protein Tco_1400554 [Tanacetum coccineum]
MLIGQADKYLSGPLCSITQAKETTELKTKKKSNPHSSKPNISLKVTVATANATKSLVASKLAEEQGYPGRKKVLNQNVEEEVKDDGFVAMEQVTFEKIMDEVDSKTQDAQENAESPYDITSRS